MGHDTEGEIGPFFNREVDDDEGEVIFLSVDTPIYSNENNASQETLLLEKWLKWQKKTKKLIKTNKLNQAKKENDLSQRLLQAESSGLGVLSPTNAQPNIPFLMI